MLHRAYARISTGFGYACRHRMVGEPESCLPADAIRCSAFVAGIGSCQERLAASRAAGARLAGADRSNRPRRAAASACRRHRRARKIPGLINEMGKLFGQAAQDQEPAEPIKRSSATGERPVPAGEAVDHGVGAHGLPGLVERRARLQAGRRPAVPEQGLQGRQEPRTSTPPKNARPRFSSRAGNANPDDCSTENFVTSALCQN